MFQVGRKTLLYISSFFLGLTQAGLGTYFYFQYTNPEVAALLEDYRWLPLVMLLTFVVFLPVGWGSVTYILVSEIVPTSVRPETAILCNSWEQLLQFGVLQLHAAVCDVYGPWYLHWGFAVMVSLGALFVFLMVPETSGKTLEEIEIFFTHLRREALDMIGDRAACREPSKQPFFLFVEKKAKDGKSTTVVCEKQLEAEGGCRSCPRT